MENYEFIKMVSNLEKNELEGLIAFLVGFYAVPEEDQNRKRYAFDFKETVQIYLKEDLK